MSDEIKNELISVEAKETDTGDLKLTKVNNRVVPFEVVTLRQSTRGLQAPPRTHQRVGPCA